MPFRAVWDADGFKRVLEGPADSGRIATGDTRLAANQSRNSNAPEPLRYVDG